MKKNFSDLLKIKKENLRDLETKIKEKNMQKESVSKEIEELYGIINSSSLPQKERIGVLNIFKNSINKTGEVINRKKIVLSDIQKDIKSLQKQYQTASIEYEKIKYINQLSIKKDKEEMQRKEQKDLDEISSLLYARKRR